MANENQYYRFPFAESGSKATVPDTSVGGAVGFNSGYGSDYELQPGSVNRKTIPRTAHNELLYGITKNLKQIQEKNYPTWIEDNGTGSPFSYDKGVIVYLSGSLWISGESGNQDVPGVGIKWSSYITSAPSIIQFTDASTLKLNDIGITFSEGLNVSTSEYHNGTGYGGSRYVITARSNRPTPDIYGDVEIDGGLWTACLDANYPIDLRSFGTKDDITFDSTDRINSFYAYIPLNESNVESVVYHAYGVVHIASSIITGVIDSTIRKAHRYTDYNLAVYVVQGGYVDEMMKYVYQNQCTNDGQLRITGATKGDGDPVNFNDRKCDFHIVVGNGVSDADLPNIDTIGAKIWGVVTSKDESGMFGGFSSVFNNVSCRFCGTGSNTDPSHPQNDASVVSYTSATYINGTSVGQRTRLALPAMPYVTDKYSDTKSYVAIGGYLYWVTALNSGANTIDVYPNIKSTELAGGALQFFYGGAFLNTGSNSAFANVKGTLKGIGCGIVLAADALYPGTFKNVQAEVNGIGFAHVINSSAAALGGVITELYCEGCQFDVVSAASANNAYFAISIGGPTDFVNKFINHGVLSYRLPTDLINDASNTGVNLTVNKFGRNYSPNLDQNGVIVGNKTAPVGSFTVTKLPVPYADIGEDRTIGAKRTNRTIVSYEFLQQVPSTSFSVNLPSVASGYTFKGKTQADGTKMTWDLAYFTATLGWAAEDSMTAVIYLNESSSDYGISFIRGQTPGDGVIT